MERLTIGPAELAKLSHLLRQVDFLSGLTVGQIEKVMPQFMHYAYAPGDAVFRQGEKGDACYLVSEGTLAVSIKRWFLGSEKQVAVLGPGDFCGEMALLDGERRMATVTCRQPAKLFALVAGDFKFVLQENPGLADELRRTAERRKFQSSR